MIGAEELTTLLSDAGFAKIEVSVVEHTIVWPDAETRAAGIVGTPYGSLVARMAPDRRTALTLDLLGRTAAARDGPLRRTTVAVLARAHA